FQVRTSTPSNDPPDREDERQRNRDDRSSKQQQRPVKNRLRFNSGLDLDWLAAHAFAERLLPGQDVAALHAKRTVVKKDPTRQMEAERCDLVASPFSLSGAATRLPDLLAKHHFAAGFVEL